MPDLAGDVETIVAELLSNALTASRRAPVQLWLVSDGRRVVISVADASPDPPVPMNPDGATESGRGLMLVEAVSARWGWYALPQGKIVWALCEG